MCRQSFENQSFSLPKSSKSHKSQFTFVGMNTSNTRRQLTLFVEPAEAEAIEQIRRRFNPVQHALIAAHVTLCREDELEPLEQLLANLAELSFSPITIDFGPVIRFSEGCGVMLPAVGANTAFHQLRRQILRGLTDNPRNAEAHITLMHPRNAVCTDEIFAQIQTSQLPRRLVFSTVSLIEQELHQPWQILSQHAMRPPGSPVPPAHFENQP